MTKSSHMIATHRQKPGEAEGAERQQKGEYLGLSGLCSTRKWIITPNPAIFGAPDVRQRQIWLSMQLTMENSPQLLTAHTENAETYHCRPVRNAQPRALTPPNAGEDGEQQNPSPTAGGMHNGPATLEDSRPSLAKLNLL